MHRIKISVWTAVGTLALAALVLAPAARADQVILDDLIVDGSACIGQDCVNGESFGFDTLRLKENNLRIKFQDTSSTASFPSNDWQLTANDSSNGGLNKFSIDDIDGGRVPFLIEAGARSNSLYVEADGDIGLGTANPVVNLHIVDGNTPTLRLEQDGSSGFTPQTWDVAGNEANFFIRDATNGSTLPLRIRPGSNSGVLDINAGTARFGTASTSGVLGTTAISVLIGPGPAGTTGPARLGFEAGDEDFALVADPGSGNLIYASTTTPAGILVLDGDGLSPNPAGAAGTNLCVSAGAVPVLCKCGDCP